MTADELWCGVSAETGTGARKGRGKRTKRKMKKDLNRGQQIGEGAYAAALSLTSSQVDCSISISHILQRLGAEKGIHISAYLFTLM